MLDFLKSLQQLNQPEPAQRHETLMTIIRRRTLCVTELNFCLSYEHT